MIDKISYLFFTASKNGGSWPPTLLEIFLCLQYYVWIYLRYTNLQDHIVSAAALQKKKLFYQVAFAAIKGS